jgi:RNA polymerase sigma-70 factor (ECF subfamily)
MTGPREPSDDYERARAAWPQVVLDRSLYERHAAGFDPAPHPDLYLACACAHGDPVAIALFDAEVLAHVGEFVRRIDPTPEFRDEVKQALRARLLVGEDGQPPRISQYAGRGPLGAWVRVAAVRAALRLTRGRGDQPLPLADERQLAATGLDPEAALLHARHQADYQAALRDALAALTARDRSLLRMHFVDGLTIDRIGAIYRIHRATAARWLQAAREQLVDETYRRLGERLQLSPAELESLTALVHSQLHLSLSPLLKE